MMIQKFFWSEYNCYFYYLFMWEGIDGLVVLMYMFFEDMYNSLVVFCFIVKVEQEYLDKNVFGYVLMFFGIGDGGGGLGEEYLEWFEWIRNLFGLFFVVQEFLWIFFEKFN